MKTQYRYKEATGVTQFAIRGLKHLHKLGKITKIIGYRYVALYKWGPRVDDRIKVFGENGIALFSGFGYGYSGEGPRGTIELFHLGYNWLDIIFGWRWKVPPQPTY
jgi:hypothetical protein